MTRGGVKEYLEAVQGRYLKGSRKEKGQILDEFTKVTGYHRKAAIRVFSRGRRGNLGSRRGRAKQYGIEVVAALKRAWESSDRLCSRRLQPCAEDSKGENRCCHHEEDENEVTPWTIVQGL